MLEDPRRSWSRRTKVFVALCWLRWTDSRCSLAPQKQIRYQRVMHLVMVMLRKIQEIRVGIDVKISEKDVRVETDHENQIQMLLSDNSQLLSKIQRQQQEISELASEVMRYHELEQELELGMEDVSSRVKLHVFLVFEGFVADPTSQIMSVDVSVSSVASTIEVADDEETQNRLKEENKMIETLHAFGSKIESHIECLKDEHIKLKQPARGVHSFATACSADIETIEATMGQVEELLDMLSYRILEQEAEQSLQLEHMQSLSERCQRVLGDCSTDTLVVDLENIAKQTVEVGWDDRGEIISDHQQDQDSTDENDESLPTLRDIIFDEDGELVSEQLIQSFKCLQKETSELQNDLREILLKQRESLKNLTGTSRRRKQEQETSTSAVRTLAVVLLQDLRASQVEVEEHQTYAQAAQRDDDSRTRQVEAMNAAVCSIEEVMEKLVQSVSFVLQEKEEAELRRSAAEKTSHDHSLSWLPTAGGAVGSPESVERKRAAMDFSPVERNSWASNMSIRSDSSVRSRSRYTFL
eukprot:757462-Hanusia_phi.AAC.2